MLTKNVREKSAFKYLSKLCILIQLNMILVGSEIVDFLTLTIPQITINCLPYRATYDLRIIYKECALYIHAVLSGRRWDLIPKNNIRDVGSAGFANVSDFCCFSLILDTLDTPGTQSNIKDVKNSCENQINSRRH